MALVAAVPVFQVIMMAHVLVVIRRRHYRSLHSGEWLECCWMLSVRLLEYSTSYSA